MREKVGKIYKYVNKLDGKVYIGQTTRELKVRHSRHLTDAKLIHDDCYFHRALRKYGESNFDLSIIEDNIDIGKLDEREQYWIKYYDSHYLNGNGYNMTDGGRWGNAPRKLNDEQILKIQELLVYTDMSRQEIAEMFNVSYYCISDIVTGKTWKSDLYNYPLRNDTENYKKVTLEKYEEVISLLKENILTLDNIALQVNLKGTIISKINTGKHGLCRKEDGPFPIRKSRVKNNYEKLKPNDIHNIIYYYLFTDYSYNDIAEIFKVTVSAIKAVIAGTNWKSYTSDYKFPLIKNLEENKNIWKIKNEIV